MITYFFETVLLLMLLLQGTAAMQLYREKYAGARIRD